MSAGDRRIETVVAAVVGDNLSVPRLIGCTAGGDLLVTDHRTITGQADLINNDSDKTFTVPAGLQWTVHSIVAILISTATGGNRQIRIDIRNIANVSSYLLSAGAVQAASLTRTYAMIPGVPRGTSFIDGNILMPIPGPLIIPASGTIRIYDAAAIDAAADDLDLILAYDQATI